jgi:hypothetical protein
MAQQGNAGISAFAVQIDGRISGMEFVLTGTNTLNFIRAGLRETSAANQHIVGAAVYDTSNNLLYTSATINNVNTGAFATYDMTFTGATLAAGTYWFVVLADQAPGDLEMGSDFNAGTSVTDDNVFGGVFPNPAGIVSAGFNDAVLIDYTAGGGGGSGSLVGGTLVNGLLFGSLA